jgi:hypothetical protein
MPYVGFAVRLARGSYWGIQMQVSHIASVAMLADLSVSQWTARKVDKARSAELTDNAKASAKAAHVSKKLVLSDTLTEINALVMQARLFHMKLTSPWFDSGARILSVANHASYMAGMEQFEAKFRPLVSRFVAEYPQIREDASREYVALGKLFDVNDYPQVSRIAARFAWRHRIMPMPNAADFRVDIGENAIQRVRMEIEATLAERANAAVTDVFERVHETVAHMVEKLDGFSPDKNGKDRGTFRDSLVENVRDLIGILPGLNFTGDKRIDALVDAMSHLVEHDAETLRADDIARRNVVANAKAIVEAVSDFMA